MNNHTSSVYSDKADVLAAFFEKRLQDNLAAFKDVSPDIYQAFSDYAEKRYFLVFDDCGHVNLIDRSSGSLIFEGDIYQSVMSNYQEYRKKGVIKPVFCVSDDLDGPVKDFMPVHDTVMRGIGKSQLDLVSKASVSFREKFIDSYVNLAKGDVSETQCFDAVGFDLPDRLGCLIAFSVGMGFDLESFYKDCHIDQLYILEPDTDIFYASLQLMDWAYILQDMKSNGKGIKIIINEDFDELAGELMHSAMEVGRQMFAGAYFYSSFHLDGYDELYSKVKTIIDRDMFSGFGFYDDSRLSLAHTYANFKSGVPCIQVDRSINKQFGQESAPVFIIGNGPSLDSDLKFIKDNASRAIVISCGTSIGALYTNEIKPDIYIELERTADSVLLIEKLDCEENVSEYLDGVLFVGMSQVHPGVFDLFDLKGQMPKDLETASMLLLGAFKDRGVPVVSGCAPSCVHTAFTASVLLGFRNIYFFGVDMGYKDREYHHSKHSIYEKMNDEKKEFFTPPASGVVEYEANLENGKVLSSGLLPMFKNALEKTVKSLVGSLNGRLHVYNCSGGAKLDDIEGLDKNEIHFPVNEFDKKGLLDAIHKSHFSFIPEESDVKLLDDVLDRSYSLVGNICDVLKESVKPVSSIEEAQSIIKFLSYDFHQDKQLVPDGETWVYSIFDGSLLYVISAVNTILYLPFDEQTRIDAFNKCVPVIKDFFDNVKSSYTERLLICDKKEFHNHF